jgi:hypothetical protein
MDGSAGQTPTAPVCSLCASSRSKVDPDVEDEAEEVADFATQLNLRRNEIRAR